MNKTLKDEIVKLEKIKMRAQSIVDAADTGEHLKCTKSHNEIQYRINGMYLPKNEISRARKIAEADYYRKLLPEISFCLNHLKPLADFYEKKSLESAYTGLCQARKELVSSEFPIIEEEIDRLMNEEYEPGEFDPNDKSEFYSPRNERVRSKSEMFISQELCMMDIPYRYERPIQLKVYGGFRTFRPDFTAINRNTGKRYFMEHLGMMDSQGYYMHTLDKLNVFEKNGYLIGRDIILFHEMGNAPINSNVVREYIREYLL